jgi:hypothetical protein
MARRWTLRLASVALAGCIAWWWRQRQAALAVVPSDAPSGLTSPAPTPDPTSNTPPPVSRPRWVTPLDGECPDGYPIKVNESSGIIHSPGGRFYARTIPERCYATAEDAEADGYRRAKA